MFKCVTQFLCVVLVCTNSFAASGVFSTKINVVSIGQEKGNAIAIGQLSKSYNCTAFKGTYEKNTVVFKASPTGGSGRYTNKVVYTFGEGYVDSHGEVKQHEEAFSNGETVSITLPELRDNTDFVQQNIYLITTDLNTGKSVTDQMLFNVSRPIIVSRSTRPEAVAKECKQIYPAYESPIGILTNSSTNPSQLTIRQGVEKIWGNLSGSQWGFYFSPFAWTFLGNIFTINRNYLKQFSKQTIETMEVGSEYQLSPGDYVQIYEQKTRYVRAFDAYRIDVCGISQLLPGEYMLQWWGLAYHAYPINPHDSVEVPVALIGAQPMNSCPADLSPGFNGDDYKFIGLNK